jgi:hypothetical protein
MQLLSLILSILLLYVKSQLFVPVELANRKDVSLIKLTEIGEYGLHRKSRPGILEHYHTGIDIKRPNNNFLNEPIYPIAKGKVISKRDDGAYANIMIEYNLNNIKFWTLYEQVAGIVIGVNDYVTPDKPIARFMNQPQLNGYGWPFDHFHLEILRIKPLPIMPQEPS